MFRTIFQAKQLVRNSSILFRCSNHPLLNTATAAFYGFNRIRTLKHFQIVSDRSSAYAKFVCKMIYRIESSEAQNLKNWLSSFGCASHVLSSLPACWLQFINRMGNLIAHSKKFFSIFEKSFFILFLLWILKIVVVISKSKGRRASRQNPKFFARKKAPIKRRDMPFDGCFFYCFSIQMYRQSNIRVGGRKGTNFTTKFSYGDMACLIIALNTQYTFGFPTHKKSPQFRKLGLGA